MTEKKRTQEDSDSPPDSGGTDSTLSLSARHLRANLKARAVSGLAITLSTQGVKFVLQILYIAIMARLLTVADFGLVAMITSITALLAVIRDGGLSTAIIQRDDISQMEISALFWINAGLGLMLALISACLSPLAATFYSEPDLVQLMSVYSVTFILSGLTVQHEALIRRQMRFSTLGAVEIVTMITTFGVGIVAAWGGMGYWSIAIGVIIGSVANCLMVWHACAWRPGRPRWPRGLGSMLRFGGHVMGFNLMSTLGMNVDKILLGRMYGSEALGLYNRAQALLLQPFAQILTPLGSVAIPTLSRLYPEPEKFRSTLLQILMVIGFVSAFVSAYIFAGSDWLVRILLGEQWSGSAVIFRAFAVTIFTMPISVAATWALTTAGLGKELSYWGVINNGILILAILCGLPWGAVGVALSYSVSGILVRVPLLYFFVARCTNIQVKSIVHVIGPAFGTFILVATYLYCIFLSMENHDVFVGLMMLAVNTSLIAAVVLIIVPWGRGVRRVLWQLISALPLAQRFRSFT